jgi:hypothetical protein
MLKRDAGDLLLKSRGFWIMDQSLEGVSAPPGKRHPEPIIAIGSTMAIGDAGGFDVDPILGKVVDLEWGLRLYRRQGSSDKGTRKRH